MVPLDMKNSAIDSFIKISLLYRFYVLFKMSKKIISIKTNNIVYKRINDYNISNLLLLHKGEILSFENW